jgi:hypothetical protein
VKKPLWIVVGFAALVSPKLTIDEATAQAIVKVPKDCIGAVCGRSEYWGGRVRILLTHKLTRFTHFNFKTNPGGAQIEVGAGGYSFEQRPGRSGTYSAQACDRGGIGARSTCTRWATFKWKS